MATTAAPYGLKPVNLIGGQPYAGSTRQIKIASAYDTNIFNGSVVQIETDGTVGLVGETGAAADQFPVGVVGVFVGCSYTDPGTKQKLFKQYWPADTVASDAVAYVVDDKDCLFQAQADGALAQTTLGNNVHFVAAQTGDTVTGNSTTALDASEAATTNTFAFRIVDFVESTTSTVGDAKTDVLVKFNAGIHSYEKALGA